MKIVVLQDFLRSGGTERQSILLARGFRARRQDVLLLTFRPGGPLLDTIDGVEHQSLQPLDLRWDWFAPALTARIRHERPDVVLAMGRMANCHLGFLSGAMRGRSGRPGVAVATFRTGKRLPWLFRRSLRLADHVVANSHEAACRLREARRVPAERLSVIHNSLVFDGEAGIQPEAQRREDLRRRVGAGPDTAVLLCVAMFRPEKNQRGLIETVSGLPAEADWQLWLAGDGPARRGCEARVRELGLDRRVKFLGFTPDPEALYAAADAAVHASRSEALSNFLIEAQAHGLPAIAYEAQGVSECFLPDQTGWTIGRDDCNAFRAAVVRLLGEPAAARRDRAAQARAFARDRFDPNRQIEAYLQLFGRLLGQR
ncbi:MAG: glycosyltransferase [Opitutaceae bacterium]